VAGVVLHRQNNYDLLFYLMNKGIQEYLNESHRQNITLVYRMTYNHTVAVSHKENAFKPLNNTQNTIVN